MSMEEKPTRAHALDDGLTRGWLGDVARSNVSELEGPVCCGRAQQTLSLYTGLILTSLHSNFSSGPLHFTFMHRNCTPRLPSLVIK